MPKRSHSCATHGRTTGWPATWPESRGPLRTLLLLAYRVVLVFILVTFFSFATLDQPILRSIYVALTSIQSAFADTFRLAYDIFDSGGDLDIVRDAYLRSVTLMLVAVVIGAVAGLLLGLAGGLKRK